MTSVAVVRPAEVDEERSGGGQPECSLCFAVLIGEREHDRLLR
jgi:hypothetical protein